MTNTFILYHGGACVDGFTSAWAAWLKFQDQATYIPANYGSPFPDIPDGSEVYLVDFSIPRKDLLALNERCSKVMVLDHHKSAQKDLEGIPFAIFDMGKSGARLTWEYFHPNTAVPRLVLFVEDRDIWKWEMEGSEEANAAIRAYPQDFETWSALHKSAEMPGYLETEGTAILRAQNRMVEQVCKNTVWVQILGSRIPACNEWSGIRSEVCQELLKQHPEAPFSACYTVLGDAWRFTLRSNGFDVSKVAKNFGGGGHQKASGFQVTWDQISSFPLGEKAEIEVHLEAPGRKGRY